MRFLAKIGGFIRSRTAAGWPVLREVVAGGQASGPNALPTAPAIVAKLSKLFMVLWPLLLGWADRKFGWGLTEVLGEDGGELVWFVLSSYLGWRTPMRTRS